MREAWKDILVQDLVDSGQAELKTGPFGTQLHASDYVEHGTFVINVRNIGFGEIRDGDLNFINDETVNRLSGHLLQAGDIVFGRKGAVERHVFIRKKYAGWFQGSDCLRLRVSSKEVEPQFLSYCFQTDFHKRWMVNHCSHGATMTSLNQEIICRIPLRLPPVKTQRQVIGILSAYDDLIENNTRRIQILEQMAQSIYREWFVHFRFPGHEKVKLVESPLGKIPQEWQPAVFTDIGNILSGGTPSTRVAEYWDGDIPWFTPRDAAGSFYVTETEKHITQAGVNNCASEIYPKDTIFITARGTVGKLALTAVPMAVNQSCYAVQGKLGYEPRFVYLVLRARIDYLKKNTGGATFDTIITDTFKRMSILKPPPSLAQDFEIIVEPFFERIRLLHLQNANLRRTRDLLLPRLISGELDVSELDIENAEKVV